MTADAIRDTSLRSPGRRRQLCVRAPALGMACALVVLLAAARPAWAQRELQGGIQMISQQIVDTMGQENKRRLAISDLSKLDGTPSNLGRYLSERLVASLFMTKRFEVMERRQLGKLLEELKLSTSDLFDPSNAKRLGGLQGVDVLAAGSLTEMTRFVEVNARLIDTASGRVLGVATAQILKDTDVLALLGTSPSPVTAPAPGGPAPAPRAPPALAPATIVGTWRGMYFYPRNNMRPVEFTVTIKGSSRGFSGRMWEPATFGNGTSDRLFADIWGQLSPGGDVTFVKKYDGTAGVSHSVSYEGSLDERGQTIEGRWKIRTDWAGVFRMTRQ
jgi:TolB-like protein